MNDLPDYLLRILPGLLLIATVFLLLPKKQILARIFLLILAFILMRDAMTPVGYWVFGYDNSVMGLPRFIDDAQLLAILSFIMVTASVLLLRIKELRRLVRWGTLSSPVTYMIGIGGGLAVALLSVLVMPLAGVSLDASQVALSLLPMILLFTLTGNFLEELLFRGFLQSHLETQTTPNRAAVISGLLFAAAHIFLASTVTNLGVLLLVFVVFEGLVCAFVYKKYGLVSAALVHGIAIFILASGVV